MKFRIYLSVALGLLTTLLLPAAESIDDAMKRAALEYGQRLRSANDELIQTRDRIAKEKTPLLQARRAAEDRIIAAEMEINRLETLQEQFTEDHRKLVKEADTVRKNQNYLATVARDSLSAYGDGLIPAEKQFLPAALEQLREGFAETTKSPGVARTVDAANLLLAQVRQSLGGYRAAGQSLLEGDTKLVAGTFAFVGPEAFFRADQGGSGTVRLREGNGTAVTYLLPEWKSAAADAFFQGKGGAILADASAGKALRLKETKGTVWQHVNKGGVVSYAIIAVGIFALTLIVLKMIDLSRMRVDQPPAVQRCLETIAAGTAQDAEQAVRSLRTTTQEIFATGLRFRNETKEQLEERLTAVLLRQRLYYERRLPLLAVIATAAPLMGLLGTVTGMVRTFTLITVFGTGNAGKLASGISEVLVATELGLMVAIPSLVVHGFLSQRIQKNLSLLERYALEFVTTVRAEKPKIPAKESIPA